ncbi:MAG: glutamyl-tRNA reductase [Candidatus Omnitrophota bacterium]
MQIVTLGINHKTAPIEVREKFCCSPQQQELLLSELRNNPSVAEAFILSTCNRLEIYAYTVSAQDAQTILKTLFSVKKIKFSDILQKHFYIYADEVAVDHFLRVAAGLDSLVLGEKQILGQVKEGVKLAASKGMLGKYFNILTNIAVRTGKKAQSETQISYGGSSISWAAVALGEKILGSFSEKSVLMIGAGKMGELTAQQIKNKGAKNLFFMNRTQSCASALASQCRGQEAAFCDMERILSEIDICFCSVGAPHFILEKSTVFKAMQKRESRPLVFIDISVPRNIDPACGEVSGVDLYHVDDLERVVDENIQRRTAAVDLVEKIIRQKHAEFYRKIEKITSRQYSDYYEPARVK